MIENGGTPGIACGEGRGSMSTIYLIGSASANIEVLLEETNIFHAVYVFSSSVREEGFDS